MRAKSRRLPPISLVLVIGALAIPLVWAFLSSIRPTSALLGGGQIIGNDWTLNHYRALLFESGFWQPFSNSLIVASATTVLTITLGGACAYALARLEFVGRRMIVAGILVIAMFPQIAVVAPLYLLLRHAGLIDTYPGLVLPYMTFAMPLAVWLLTATFRAVPRSLEQAAWLDGASPIRAALHIVLPQALPGIGAAAIVTFVYSWNEFLFSLAFTLGPERQTLPVAIALLRGRYQVPWGQILAASVLATAPIAVLVLVFQRRLANILGGGRA